MRAAVVSGARVEKVSEGRRDKPANWRAGESTSEQSFGARHVAVFLVKILPGIKNTNLRRGPTVGGPTSANLSSLSLSLRRCCHDQPSLVGDPRSLDGRYHSLILTRNALLAFGPRVRVLS